jgi:DNA-directed RNA polymerase specialized sigma subunit
MGTIIPITTPHDGWEDFEKVFLKQTVINMYRCLKNPKDKFILMAVKELGYSQEVVGRMVGLFQEDVSIRLKKIIQKLRRMKYDEDLDV